MVLDENAKNAMNNKKTDIEVIEETEQTRSKVNRIRKGLANLIGHIMRSECLEHLSIGKAGRKREFRRTRDNYVSCTDKHKKDKVCSLGNQESRSLERHDRQHLDEGHLHTSQSTNHHSRLD